MEKEKNKPITWMGGALYLSIAAFVAKGLSALYKVPYQNMTGDIGYYVYQQVYPLYGIVFTLGTYGFPMVISKILAEKEEPFHLHKNRMIVYTIVLFCINGWMGSGIIYFSHDIASWMGDENLANPLRWLGVPFFIIPFLSVNRGYFQSKGNMLPTSISQVLEQFVRITVILLVAYWAMRAGSPYKAGVSAGIGAFAGGLAGMLFMLRFWRKELSQQPTEIHKSPFQIPSGIKKDVKDLFISGFLVSISAMTLIIFQMVDSFSTFRLLLAGGWRVEEAATLKGVYDRGWPMIQLGAVVTTVFSYASIPLIWKAKAAGEKKRLHDLLQQAVKVCIVFGGAASIGLIIIMPHLNPMLFIDNTGVGTLRILSISVLAGALFMSIAALLHGLGKASYAAILLLFGIVLKGLGNAMMVPSLSIKGAALSTSITLLIIAAASTYLLKKFSIDSFWKGQFWLKWVLSLIGMALTVVLFQHSALFLAHELSVTVSRSFHSGIAISSAALGAVVFLVLIWWLRLFTKHEWETLPKLSKILSYRNRK